MMTIGKKLKSLYQRELFVFDFDETIVDCNSDSWVHQLLADKRIPLDLEYRMGQDYFKHVQSVLNHLYSKGVRKRDYNECLGAMPAVEGIVDPLIKTLGNNPDTYDVVILSDANSFFIDSYLQATGLKDSIFSVITNHGEFSDDGQLLIKEYHNQTHCDLSSRNLCKGEALKNFIGRRMLDDKTVYNRVYYVGDGQNDFCPCVKLGSSDFIFPRKGYPLERICNDVKSDQIFSNEVNEKRFELKATVVPWTDGRDILQTLTGRSLMPSS